jgi:hypothetical protein
MAAGVVKVVRVPGPGHRILAALATLGEFQARVGWFSSAKYRNGVAVAYIAAIQEFGYAPKNIPPRLGLRDMLKKQQGEYRTLSNQIVRAVMNGMPAKDALIAISGKAEGDVRKSITRDGIEPLKKSTLQNRASRLGIPLDELTETGKKPLVEPVMSKAAGGGAGGLLLSTVTSMVVPKGAKDE